MKQIYGAIVLIISVAIALSIASTASSLDDYIYYSKVTVTNDTATPVFSRVEIPVNAKFLIDNYYIQPDAEDIALSKASIEEDVVALDLANNSVDWITEHFTVPANSSMALYMWYGDSSATRNQKWIADTSDTCTAADANSLDFDTVEINADVELTATPSAGGDYLVNKQWNYDLYATTGTWTFTMWEHITDAGNLTPTADGTLIQHGSVGCPAGNFDCVNDAPPLGAGADGTYITGGINQNWIDRYTMEDPHTSLSTTALVVEDVSVYLRATSTAGVGTIQSGIYLPSTATTTYAPPHTANIFPIWSNYTDSGLTRPGGGNWTCDDLKNMEGVIHTVGTPGGTHYASQFYIRVTGYYADPHTVSIPIVIDIERPLSASYNGANIGITDGVNTDTNALVLATTSTRNFDLHICELNAKVDNLTLDDASGGTYTLNLTFEPVDITSGTITDHSSSGNDITYVLAAMDAALDVDAEGLIPQPSLATSYDQILTADVGGLITQPVNWHNTEEESMGENVGNIPDAIMSPLSEVSGLDTNWMWWFGYGVIMIVVFLAVLRTTAQNLLMAWLAGMVITGLFVTWGPIPWWFLAFYAIGAISTLTMERRTAV